MTVQAMGYFWVGTLASVILGESAVRGEAAVRRT
jgi:hypothetical protein